LAATALWDGTVLILLAISEKSKPRYRQATDGREKQRIEQNKMIMVAEVR